MTTVAIHQPEYFCALTYLYKLARCDRFVLLDTTDFSRDSFQQRTKIMGPNGKLYLTIPYRHKGRPQALAEVEIDQTMPWRRAHSMALQTSYGRTAGYLELRDRIDRFYAADWISLLGATTASVWLLAEWLGLRDKIVLASTLDVWGKKGELVLNLCQALGAEQYLSGAVGANYLDRESFDAAGIAITVAKYEFPPYRQRWSREHFDPVVSGLDLVCNLGKDGARAYLEGLR